MTTKEIATRLAQLCSAGKFETAQKELFADDAVSIEPMATPEFDKETKGLDAIIKKGEKFDAMVEVTHGIEISEPLVAPNSIAFLLKMGVTMKGKERMDMSELCVYKTKSSKIISEEFFM